MRTAKPLLRTSGRENYAQGWAWLQGAVMAQPCDVIHFRPWAVPSLSQLIGYLTLREGGWELGDESGTLAVVVWVEV